MEMRAFRALFFACLLAAPAARADEVAPELELETLRQAARGELKRLLPGLSAGDQKRLTGLYLAFDPSPSELVGQVACDDDGDYVIVLSEGMLRLVSTVARAQSYDEANGTRKIEDYAGYVARNQIPGRRLLPPQAGFYIAMKPASSYDDRLREALAFVIARELVHLRAGDLSCAHPTATKEAGDDEWTAGEQRRAGETAANVYPGRGFERDTEGAVRMLDSGHKPDGAFGLMRFFTQLQVEQTVVVSRWVPLYQTQHPGGAVRASAIKKAIEVHQEP
jgi:hypothetical protein